MQLLYNVMYKSGMLGLEAWPRPRGLSKPKFCGLGLEGPGLGLVVWPRGLPMRTHTQATIIIITSKSPSLCDGNNSVLHSLPVRFKSAHLIPRDHVTSTGILAERIRGHVMSTGILAERIRGHVTSTGIPAERIQVVGHLASCRHCASCLSRFLHPCTIGLSSVAAAACRSTWPGPCITIVLVVVASRMTDR